MHTVILTQNMQQAAFIRKGLSYENISAEIIPANRGDIEKNLQFIDGIFLHLDTSRGLAEMLSRCHKWQPGKPLFVLANKLDRELEGVVREGKIDYCAVRPFHFRQLAMEMRHTIFRKKEKIEHERYILRDLELDIPSHRVKYRNKSLHLRNKEFSLLQFMMANRGKVLTRNEILENVWDRNASIMTNTVDVHVSQLRRKIDRTAKRQFIRTVPCTGYILE